MLVYLSDVEEGGETSFLFEGVNGTKRLSTVDYKTCNTGIKYKPRAGDALLFWSIHPDHTSDKHALHGGCPVVRCFDMFRWFYICVSTLHTHVYADTRDKMDCDQMDSRQVPICSWRTPLFKWASSMMSMILQAKM